MNPLKAMLAGASLLLSLGATDAAQAHSAWLDLRGKEAVLLDGHPDTGEARAYEPQRLVAWSGLDEQGRAVPVAVRHEEGAARFDLTGSIAVLSAHFNNGFWAVSPSQGWVRKPGTEVPDAEHSMYSHKYTRAHLAPTTVPDRLMGHPLEMVALSDPTAARPGSPLRVRVTLFGEPLAGAEISSNLHAGDAAEVAVSGADGIATVTVPDRDFVVLETTHGVGLSDDAHVDAVHFAASLAYRPTR